MANNSSYLQSGEILELGEIVELQVEGVDADEAVDVDDVEDGPRDEHDDVVGEDHVVDDGRVEPGHDAPRGEEGHHDQPALEEFYVLR